MPVFRECANFEMCLDVRLRGTENKTELNILNCEGCHTYNIYKKGFEDGVQSLASQLMKLATKNGQKDIRDIKQGGQ